MLPGKDVPCFLVSKDNQGAAQLAQNSVTNLNFKRIDVRYHFFREPDILITHVPSEY